MSKLTLEHLVRPPKINIENPPLLIMLHGYGSNEQDLFSFAEELPDELLIISARAPLSLGFGSYAWYTIHFNNDSNNFSDISEAKDALSKISIFLDEILAEYKPNNSNIFMLGFSQGTILATAFALNNPDKIQHIIALSGYVNEKLINNGLDSSINYDLDFFVSHGTADQVIPVDWARKTPGYLDKLEIENSYQEYPVGHGVAPQNFYDLNTWIIKRI
jgi:phospholipase/carboxylesterase